MGQPSPFTDANNWRNDPEMWRLHCQELDRTRHLYFEIRYRRDDGKWDILGYGTSRHSAGLLAQAFHVTHNNTPTDVWEINVGQEGWKNPPMVSATQKLESEKWSELEGLMDSYRDGKIWICGEHEIKPERMRDKVPELRALQEAETHPS